MQYPHKYQFASLRAIAERASLPHLNIAVQKPGIKALYRITVHHLDFNLRHSVATVTDNAHGQPQMEIRYEGLFDQKPICYTIKRPALEGFMLALQKAGFDKLEDQPEAPLHESTLWLVEKAVGTYYKCVIFSADKPELPYSRITNAIDDYLPEAVRKVGTFE